MIVNGVYIVAPFHILDAYIKYILYISRTKERMVKMLKKDIVVKIDFKTTSEKKEKLKEIATKKNVNVSYIMNQLLDNFLSGNLKIEQKKKIASHLVSLVHTVNYFPDSKIKERVLEDLEELQCLM